MGLLESVKNAGVIGAGGAGFPTHVKLAAKAELILLNGAECEPLLQVDEELMGAFPDEILKGFVAAGKQVEATKGIIGIKGKHAGVIALLKERINQLGFSDYIEVAELKDVYPVGDEQMLVYELTGRIVPQGGIPLKVGCVVLNAETALNIFYASEEIPVTETYITVGGDVPNPVTIKVAVGTPIREVLQQSGLNNLDDVVVIDGGPMMGKPLENLDDSVTKKSKGYVVLQKDHRLIAKKKVDFAGARRISRSVCEQCRMCTDLCPRYLLGHSIQPHKIMRTANMNVATPAEMTVAQLCCECGACEYFACPAGIFPKTMNVFWKEETAKAGLRYENQQVEFSARSPREYRLIPSKRLIAKIGLAPFNLPAPLVDRKLSPKIIRIERCQHIGKPTEAMVSVGQQVRKGQMIGNVPADSLGAPIHASLDGTVLAITDRYIEIEVAPNV